MVHIKITLFNYLTFPIIIYRHATTNQVILSLVTEVKKKKNLPEDGQRLTETCRRILRLLKQYDQFNVLF